MSERGLNTSNKVSNTLTVIPRVRKTGTFADLKTDIRQLYE